MDIARTARRSLMAGRVVVGGGTLVAPRPMGAVFGVDPARNPAVPYVGRLFGVRALFQVVMLASADPDDRARQLGWGVAVDLIDAAAAAAAGRRGELSRRAAGLAGAAAVAEAALGCIALAADRLSGGRG